MVPKWRFRDVPQQPNRAGAFFEREWPSDLPESCQVCGTKFRTGFNISHGPGKTGRILRTTAYFSFLPCLVLGPIITSLIPGMYDGFRGSQGWWMLFGSMFIPPLFLAGLSVIMPLSRHLECKKCGWDRDYKPLPPPKLDPGSDKA